jgi:hypothetical protein
LTCFLKFELNFVDFFTINLVGFCLYGYLVCVFVFGRKIPKPGPYQEAFVLIAALIILDVISLAIFFNLVLRFQAGRDLIYTYVPRDYVISGIGNPGSKALVRAIGLMAAVTGIGLAEQAGQSWVNRLHAENDIEVCRQAGQATKDGIIDNMMQYRGETGAKIGSLVTDPVRSVFKTIVETVQPPTKP